MATPVFYQNLHNRLTAEVDLLRVAYSDSEGFEEVVLFDLLKEMTDTLNKVNRLVFATSQE
jgi:hypothetical protein